MREVFVLWCPAIREGVVLINLSVLAVRDGLAGRGQRAAVVEGVLEHEADRRHRQVLVGEAAGEPPFPRVQQPHERALRVRDGDLVWGSGSDCFGVL